jgi:hypothetical protein
VIAVLIVQEIAKPLVDRHSVLTGGLSYPSGTVAAVAALATALTLVMPAQARFPVALLGLLAIGGTGAAVIVLRWHYPTDALGVSRWEWARFLSSTHGCTGLPPVSRTGGCWVDGTC